MLDVQECSMNNQPQPQSPQCQFFVARKKRLCRMTVRPGRSYCGEHEPQPDLEVEKDNTRIPCPNDPKHTCYARRLQKHLSICNARASAPPPYIVRGLNAPAAAPPPPRPALRDVPTHLLLTLIDKINRLYDEYVKDEIVPVEEFEIHPVVMKDYAEADRTESSRRHLEQVSSLLWLAEREGLVRDRTCYVELGAGKGHLSYYAWRAWCAGRRGSRVLLVDRAALRHKRDNKLRDLAARAAADANTDADTAADARAAPDNISEEQQVFRTSASPEREEAVSRRLRADLADLALLAVPEVQEADHVVAFAKHLCGVATDYALRCATAAGGKTRGLVLATCCHHRCQEHALFGLEHLQALGVSGAELAALLGVVSWGTCGDGRPRGARPPSPTVSGEAAEQQEATGCKLPRSEREEVGLRAKALLDWARARRLRAGGLRARLVRYVRAAASPENMALVAAHHAG